MKTKVQIDTSALKDKTDIASLASRRLQLADQIAILEAEKKQLDSVLKVEALKGEREKSSYKLRVDGYILTLTEQSRDTFSIKDAEKELTAAQFKKWVSPHIKTTEFQSLRVKAVK